jgi:hypothetical protein
MSFKMEIFDSDLDLIPVTNVGPYTAHQSNVPGHRIIGTDDAGVFAVWRAALDKAGRTYTVF